MEEKKRKTKNQYKPNPLAKKYGHSVHKKQATGVNGVNKKIRDLQRLLKKQTGMNAQKKQEITRQIESLELQVEEHKQREKEQELAKKYQYVKFVEQKKTTKRITKLQKQLGLMAKQDDGYEELERQLEEFQFNLLYIKYYPVDVKYISLYPSESNEKESESESKISPKDIAKGKEKTERLRLQIAEKLRNAQENGLLKDGFVLRMKQKQDKEDHNEEQDEEEQDEFFME
ncbi:18S rRNA maturation protein [Boothiomyces macroporosus]|uniref:rRNA-processing protein EFG1 n=1 Tax=Boothiomyces macroporosus TaxID=261099 RepID=A0AAD5UPV3_9FUNG|nr:18S rRNA maturation protein [Boothiomyces macroporosus]